MKIKNQHLLAHIAVWLIVLITMLVRLSTNDGRIESRFLFMSALHVFLFYINYFYFVPKFLLQQKIILYLLLATVAVILPAFLVQPATQPEILPPFMTSNAKLKFYMIFIPILIGIAFLVIGTSMRIYIEWHLNVIKRKEIEHQKNQSELQVLKSQLSPHFLFNSLNSIFSLSSKKSDNAPEAIITLSELLRYMLYQTDRTMVPLREELDYIQNYLKLQILRIARSEHVTFHIHGNVSNQKITPLLLISFIENAFKYGTDYKGDTEVKIRITIAQQQLNFSCINLIGKKKESKDHGGIGLRNTRERLKLLYPVGHDLNIFTDNNRFHVNLKLDLSQ